MNRGIKSLVAVLVVALAVACGSSPVLTAVTLAYRYTAGAVHTFNFVMTTKGTVGSGSMTQPLDETINATMAYKTVSVDPDGTATMQLTMTIKSMVMNGREVGTTVKPQTFTMKIAKNGSVVAGSGFSAGAGAGSLPGSDQLNSLLPDHPVKTGDTWDVTVNRPNPMGSGSFKVTTHNRFLNWETVAGHQDAVIESKSSLPVNLTVDLAKMAQFAGNASAASMLHGTMTEVGTMSIDTTSWLQEKSGQLDRATNNMSMDLTMTYPPGFAGSPSAGSSHLKGTFDMKLTAV